MTRAGKQKAARGGAGSSAKKKKSKKGPKRMKGRQKMSKTQLKAMLKNTKKKLYSKSTVSQYASTQKDFFIFIQVEFPRYWDDTLNKIKMDKLGAEGPGAEEAELQGPDIFAAYMMSQFDDQGNFKRMTSMTNYRKALKHLFKTFKPKAVKVSKEFKTGLSEFMASMTNLQADEENLHVK